MKIINIILKVITAALVIVGGFKLLGAVGSLELDYITCSEFIKQALWSGALILAAHIVHELRLFWCIDNNYSEADGDYYGYWDHIDY